MKKLAVSLIIPAYNEEKYIRDCLNHVIKNGKDFFHEIILVDNASTDQTVAIVKDFPSIKLVHEHKKGPTFARQKGFRESTGNILAFIDADTLMPAEWCATLEENFENDPDLVCLSGPYSWYDFPAWQKWLVDMVCWKFGAQVSSELFGNIVAGGNFVIRRNTLEKMHGFDESIAFYGDDINIGRRAEEFGTVKFDQNFIMPTSGRRFNNQGFWKIMGLYVVNYFAEVFTHKPVTEDYLDIR